MAQIKIKVIINEGRKGVSLDKLSSFSGEWEQFLRSLSADSGIDIKKGQWIANNFENNTVSFNAETNSVDDEEAVRFSTNYDFVVDYDPDLGPHINIPVSNDTLLRYANLIDVLDVGEQAKMGLYRNGEIKEKDWKTVTKDHAIKIRREIQAHTEYYGTISGVIHALYKEVPQPYFQIREQLKQGLIKCEYGKNIIYETIYRALEREHAIVYVHGLITASALTKEIERIVVDSIEAAPELTREDYDKFFGMEPNYTGNKSTADAINDFWGDDE